MECRYSRCQNLYGYQESQQCSCSLRPANLPTAGNICSSLFSPVLSPVSVIRVLLGNPSSSSSSSSSLTCRSSPLTTKQITNGVVSLKLPLLNSALSQEVCARALCVCLSPQRVWADMSAKSPKLCLLSNFDVEAPAKQKSLANNMVDQRLGSLPGNSMWTRQTKAETGPPGLMWQSGYQI